MRNNTLTADSHASATLGHGRVHPGDIAIGVIIGRTSEFFDFFVYAIASVLVFPKLLFPYADALTATLLSFALFTLAFLARPLGTWLFTEIERRHGRGTKLTISLLLLGTFTVAIAFLPGHATIGDASVLCLALFRFGQGLAWGGTWDGLPSLLSLNAPANKRGWYAMIPQLGALLGLVVASLLFAYFSSTLSAQEFLSWGWRYPFFVAFALNVVGLFARLRIVTTPEYATQLKSSELQPTSAPATIRKEGLNIVLGAFTPLASFALFHMMTVFPLSWIFLFTSERPTDFLIIEALGATLGMIAIALSGMLADKFGRHKLLGITAGLIAAFSGIAPQLLDAGETGQTVYILLGFSLLGIAFGQSSGAVAHRFVQKHRYTASALTTDLAWLFGAGFAPLAALLLTAYFGLMASGAYLLSGAVCTLMALALSNAKAR